MVTINLISLGQLHNQIKKDGTRRLIARATKKMAIKIGDKLSWSELDFPLRQCDIADPDQVDAYSPPPIATPVLKIGWVCTPPGPASGGHTTLFRMVEGMERRGHKCTLFLYDVNSDEVVRHEALIRQFWPDMKASVRSATTGLTEVDAVVASSWPTAHVIANRAGKDLHRFYFIQDFEPYFYARGSLYTMAEASYRLGLTPIALGEMVRWQLRQEVGLIASCTVPFGCDTKTYRPLNTTNLGSRNGVVFYAKKAVDRRGYILAKLALEDFHANHPEQLIHVYGEKVSNWKFPVVNHGSLSPEKLNKLYNQTITSLVMSFTNISLVAEELIAAGNRPVLNDSCLARADLHNESAVWAKPTRTALSSALSTVVTEYRADVSSSQTFDVRRGWETTQRLLSEFIESSCR